MADRTASSQPLDGPVSWDDCTCAPCRERARLEEALFFVTAAGYDPDEVDDGADGLPPCEGAGDVS